MKHLAPILFILVLFTQIGLKIGVGTWFMINQSDIIEKYCINKEKTELQCNGKCHLSKQIALIENHSTENENTNDKHQNKLPVVQEFVQYFKILIPLNIDITKLKSKYIFTNKLYSEPYFNSDSPPPQNNV